MMEAAILNGFGIKGLRILNTCSSLKGNLIILKYLAPDVFNKAYPMITLLTDSKLETQSF
jgi:hypothetical protein